MKKEKIIENLILLATTVSIFGGLVLVAHIVYK